MKLKHFIFAFLAMLSFTISGFAQTTVSSEDELKTALTSPTGGEITLAEDVTLKASIETGSGNYTLNLNNHQIKGDFSGYVLKVGGTLTIKGDGEITGKSSILYCRNGGTINIEGGVIRNSSNSNVIFTVGTLNVNGGSILSTTSSDKAIQVGGNGKINLYGGIVTSLFVDKGSLNITGKNVTVENGINVGANAGKVNISAGTIKGDVTIADEAKENVTISGGSFPDADVSEYLENGMVRLENGEVVAGMFKVEETGVYYPTLAAALEAATDGATVTLLSSTEESIATINNVKLQTTVAGGVTVKNTYSDWINMVNVTIGTGVTLDMKSVFYKGGENVIEGKLNAATLYNGYNAKTTVQDGGKIATTGMIVNRYHTAADAGIYVYGDGDASTVEVSCANTIGTYSGTFYAKDAVVNGDMLWIDYLKGSTQEADNYSQSKPVFENSTVNITKEFRFYKDATLTLVNSDVTAGTVQIRENATPTVNVDANSTVKATTVQNLAGASMNAVLENGVVSFKVFVAKVGDKTFYTLDEAVQAAKVGDKITLLDNADLAFAHNPMYNNIYASEIDLNGKTLTIKEGDLRFNNVTIKNGNIIVQSGLSGGTAVFLMYSKNLTFDAVKITATGYAVTYLIDLEGTSNLNLLNGSEILVDNTTAIDTDIICSNNGATENKIVIENSKVTVNNIDGRVFFGGNYTVKDSEINLADITKAGFRINAGQKLSIEGTSSVTVEGALRDGGIHLVDVTSTYTKAETATVNATVNAPKVAEVNGVKYASFAEAAAAANAGDEIKLLANINGDITVPAGVTLNGNGFVISGGIFAEGDITFAGVTTAADFDANVANTDVNIPAGASLQLTGSARWVIGHGATFNITGTIEDAKTADKATLVPSLKIAAGASITGNGVIFNVNNAYIVANANTTSKNSNANGTLDFNINNSIWEQTGVLAFYVPTSGKDPVVNFELKNSVLTTTSHLVFSVTKGEIVFDNSLVNQGTARQLENRSTMTIKNGSVVNGAVATSSNAKNPGTIIVENATYAVTGEFSGSDLGTGTLTIKKGATVSVGSITKANITVDATDMAAGDEINLTANLSKLIGTLSVINNDKLEAKIVDGKVVLAAKPVAKIGETPYTTLEAAFKASTSGCTIDILSDVTVDYNWDARYTGGKFTVPVTINGNGKTIKFTASVNDNNYQAPFRFESDATVKNLTIDMSGVTDNRFRAISSKGNLTVDGCKFIGKDESLNCRAIIFGEGACANVGNLAIAITNSEFINWKRGITDNENAQDVKTVTITGNTLTDAGVGVSAKETVTFTGNTVEGAYVNIKSYTAGNKLAVTATGNTLEANTDGAYNVIDAGGVVNAEGFNVVAKGNNFNGYTGSDRIWGEVWGNARESFVIKVLDAKGNVMGTTSLNNIDGIIDGDVNVTWSILFNAPAPNPATYWSMEWTTVPSISNMPARVALWVDGVEVSGGPVVLNGPDDISKIYAAVTDANGNILSCHTQLTDAVAASNNVAILRAGTYKVPTGKNLTITGAVEGVKFANIGAHNMGGASMTFNNVTFEYGNENYKGLQHAGNLVYNNCTFNGQVFLYGQSETFNKCTFKQTSADAYNVWTYSAKEVAFNECTFNSAGKSVLIYHEDASIFNNVAVTKSTFNASHAVEGKAAIEMDASLTAGINLTIDAETTANGFATGSVSGNSLWNNKKGNADEANNDITVIVDGKTVLAPVYEAKIGEKSYRYLADAITAAKAGETVNILAGTYKVPTMKAGITVEGAVNADGTPAVLLEGTLSGTLENLTLKNLHIKDGNAQRWAYAKGNLVFENVTFEATSVYALHFDDIAAGTNLTYKGCTIIGWAAMGGSPESCTFEGCTIKGNGTYGVIRTYFDATIKDCTFDVANVNTTDGYQDGIHAVDGAKVTVTDCTNKNGAMEDLVNVHASSVVTVDGVEYKNVAKVGNIYYATLAEAFAAVGDGTGKTVELIADVDLAGAEWTPVTFNSIFDGKGHTISNLVVNGAGNSNQGFFAQTQNGEIKNVTFNNAKVTGRLNVGVVAGTPYTSKYTNVKVTGHVEVNGMAYVGGVGGKNAYADWTDITVDVDATSYVKATSTENGTAYRTYVGGVIGFNGEGGHTFKNISSNIKVIGDVMDIGGIFGILHYGNKAENITFTGAVEAPAGATQVGGIAGVWHNEKGQTVTINNATSTGTVTIGDVTTTGSLVGGAYNAKNQSPETSGSLIIDGKEAWVGVAKIGDKPYATLAEAVVAAKAGETITLITDIQLTEAIKITKGKDVTIAGEGKTITSADGQDAFYVTGGKLTLAEGLNVHATTDCAIYLRGGDVFTAANLTKSGDKYHVIQGNGSYVGNVTITGGKVEHKANNTAIYWPQNGKLTITGGEIIGHSAVYIASGYLEITGGTLHGVGETGSYEGVTGGSADSPAEALTIENVGGNSGYELISSVVISGGTFISDHANAIGNYANTTLNPEATPVANFISGGTFSSAVLPEWCATDYAPVVNANGTYGVESTVLEELTLVDGEFTEFVNQNDKTVGEFSYTRTFRNSGVWNAIYLPVAVPMSAIDLDKYEVAYINDVHSEDKNSDGEINLTDNEMWMEVVTITDNNATLKAYHPYVIKAKSDDDKTFNLTLNDVIVKKAEEVTYDCSSMYQQFNIQGTCRQRTKEELAGGLVVSVNGGWVTSTTAMNPFRLFMTITDRNGEPVEVVANDSQAMRIKVRGEEDTTDIEGVEFNTNGEELIFDLQGRRVLEPKKGGIYIINGKKVYYNK